MTEPCHGEIRQEPLPPLAAGQVRIETLYSGISRGTETLVFRGEVPESQREAMRCPFQAGDFPGRAGDVPGSSNRGPVKYGYMAVGRVLAGPDDLVGRPVFALHPHQDAFVIPADMAVPLPDGLPPERAVLAANMETALNVMWDADLHPGQRVTVIGLGVVGLLVAWLIARRGDVEILAIDTDPKKRATAKALSLPFETTAPKDTGFDRIIHASGHPTGLVEALSIAAFEARIVEASWFGTRPVSLPLGEDFHSKRLSIVSSQVGAVSPAMRDQGWTHRMRMEKALSLLRDPVLDVLIDGESAFEDLPETMAALADGRRSAMCHRVRYPAAER